ncbi:hypothetical protein ACQ5SO_05870 [Rhodovulum sp. DZ06]|uniref:hypothetical protein n=1 Tax=Rhodovulum sp. DZ06 TaxID=3425126 RepID=UPI003D353F2C
MDKDTARASRPMAALRHARGIYRQVTERFLEEAARLGDVVGTVAETKEFAALAAAHNKALSALMEFEARIEKQISERIGRGRGEFDLRRARDEILGKLAGLATRERSA